MVLLMNMIIDISMEHFGDDQTFTALEFRIVLTHADETVLTSNFLTNVHKIFTYSFKF